MTKVYLVRREQFCKEELISSYISSVFTNKRKAISLKRFLEACDKEDDLKYPHLKSMYKMKTYIDETTIDQMDYNQAALDKEQDLINI